MKKVAIYARVSTEKQAEEQTIESQLAELRSVCKSFPLAKEYADRGWSGETLDRPALDALRQDARNGGIERLYIHSLDRLSRNLYQQGILVEELRKHGVQIYVKDKPIDFTGEGKLLFDLLGAVAEYEKWKILERTHRGRLYKARYKGIVGGYAPYGYRYVKKSEANEERYEVHDQEAETVRLIFDLYLELKSLNAVRQALNRRGIKTQRSKGRWCRTTIRAILTNESYTGTGYYGKRQSVESENSGRYRRKLKSGVRLRDRSEWIPIRFPAIIGEEVFKTTQKLLAHNYRPYAQTMYFYLLSGLIRCARCNSTFTGETKHNKYQHGYGYYRCNNRHRSNPRTACDAPVVRINDMDAVVWRAVSEAVMRPSILANHIMELAGSIQEGKDSLLARKEGLEERARKLDEKKRRLVELYTDGDIDKLMFAEEMAAFAREEEGLRSELSEVELLLSRAVDRAAVMKHVEGFCQLARSRVASFGAEQKRQFLWNLIDVVVFDAWQRKAKIRGHIPTPMDGPPQTPRVSSGTLYTSSRSCVQCPAKLRGGWKFEIEVLV